MLEKVISGGQTGADQAGLRAARECGIATGGFAPRGWKTEHGPRQELLLEYGLEECSGEGYKARTWANVAVADATIRIASDFSSRGERCTRNAIDHFKKPFVDIAFWSLQPDQADIDVVAGWLNGHQVKILNVAGNCESHCPGIYRAATDFLIRVFKQVRKLEGNYEAT
jgi:hypothetical protein